MMTAYYSKGCDSKQMFSKLKISEKDSYEENLNKYDVIHFDVQWCIEPAGSVEKVVSFITENVINELREIFHPNAVVNLMLLGEFQSYWSQTGTYESIIPLINKNFDGLKTAVIAMISGDEVNVRTATFQNDMITFRNKDDVLTLLVHLGYLAYNQKRQTAYIPNEEIRMEFIDAECVIETYEKI